MELLGGNAHLAAETELAAVSEPGGDVDVQDVYKRQEQIFDIIKNLHKAGTTILLVEQNAQAALSVADRGYVLETGKIVTTGTGAELLASPAIKKAYLGG